MHIIKEPSHMISFKLWPDHDDYYFPCCIILKLQTLILCYFQLLGKVIDPAWTNKCNVNHCTKGTPSCVLNVANPFHYRRWLQRMGRMWPLRMNFFQLVSKYYWRQKLVHKILTNGYFWCNRSWQDLCKILIPANEFSSVVHSH